MTAVMDLTLDRRNAEIMNASSMTASLLLVEHMR
jgi:hypothetical protein